MNVSMEHLLREFQENGYLVVRGAFNPERLIAVRDQVLGHSTGQLNWRVKYAGGEKSVAETSNLFAQVPELKDLIAKSTAFQLVESLIGQETYLFRDAFIQKLPNPQSFFPLHQDSEFWDIQPEELISMWIPFQDTNSINGVLEVVPGSHKVRYPHYVKIGEQTKLPPFVNLLLRRNSKNSNMSSDGAVKTVKPSKLRTAVSNFANSKMLPFLSRNFKAFEKFAELFVVENDDEFWTKTIVPDLKVGDCILYHSKTIHGSRGNQTQNARISYVPTFMGSNYTRDGIPISDSRLGYVRMSKAEETGATL
jgi:ectoine hydroxylase-related dioxygenase (phytanoyl-CoA dioxygenase family)